MKVAIIGGTGKMGRWFTRFLLQDGKEVLVIGRDAARLAELKRQLDVETSTEYSAAESADAIVISVPITGFEETVLNLQPHVHPHQIVMDITSVKERPVALMHQYLEGCTTLGVHPMFGPGAKDIANQNFILTPTSPEEDALAQKVRAYLEARGARVTIMTPQEQDNMMAYVLGLAHFIALVAAETLLGAPRFKEMEAVSGSSYRMLLTLVKGVIGEDPDFYASLQMNLPGLVEVESVFQKNLADWLRLVRNRDTGAFAGKMDSLRKCMQALDPDFARSYQDMYRFLEIL